ncbi:MAG: PIN domain-containing protein, partial [Thermodesulfobacteriota bacterium]
MLLFIKALLVVFAAFSGYIILNQIVNSPSLAYVGFISGIIIAVFALLFEEKVKKVPLRIVAGGAIGLIIGLIVANLVTYPLSSFIPNAHLESLAYLFANCVIGYLGLSIGMKKGEDLKDFRIRGKKQAQSEEEKSKPKVESRRRVLMDTSVIIDGRIKDICNTGFLDNNIIVPQFVLVELQNIADSSDPVRRVRGKRGLDILQELQKNKRIGVTVVEDDPQDVKAVDSKLVALAKEFRVKILTNDANLEKVAELQGVSVLNINVLANALKPVVM